MRVSSDTNSIKYVMEWEIAKKQVFSCEYYKISKAPILKNISKRLFLRIVSNSVTTQF